MVIEPSWAVNGSGPSQNGSSGRGSPTEGGVPFIKSIFPANYKQLDVLKSAAQFAFPCPTNS